MSERNTDSYGTVPTCPPRSRSMELLFYIFCFVLVVIGFIVCGNAIWSNCGK